MSGAMKEPFFTLSDGREASLYTIAAGNIVASITDFGGALTTLIVPGRDGVGRDVVLGHDNPADYQTNKPYFGALVGRFANRIRGGRFQLNGKEYNVVCNEKGRTSLHGGKSYAHRLWTVADSGKDFLTLTIESPDGDAGFPGNLRIEATYRVSGDDTLTIDYKAVSDADTPLNLTNHAYFNLNGGGSIADQHIRIAAGYRNEVNQSLIPTGWLSRVNGTPFDLRKETDFASVIAALPQGIDHNYVLDDACSDGAAPCATAYSPASGIEMQCFTTEPGIQLYMSGAMTRTVTLKGGKKGFRFAGFCLETQHFPDSPNHPEFPDCILRKGQTFHSTTSYRFRTR